MKQNKKILIDIFVDINIKYNVNHIKYQYNVNKNKKYL